MEDQTCKKHGVTAFVLRKDGRWRCQKCASEAVTRARKKHRDLLIEEAGGRCQLCHYSKYSGALHFHHVKPDSKSFALSGIGQTYSLARKRAEAEKCVLVCANCHAELHAGIRGTIHKMVLTAKASTACQQTPERG